MSTGSQHGVVADFLEDLARFASSEGDRLQLLNAAMGFRTAGQPFPSENEELGNEAA